MIVTYENFEIHIGKYNYDLYIKGPKGGSTHEGHFTSVAGALKKIIHLQHVSSPIRITLKEYVHELKETYAKLKELLEVAD